jgi:hypothetical protein
MDTWICGLTASPRSRSILAISVITCQYERREHPEFLPSYNKIKAEPLHNEVFQILLHWGLAMY